MGTPARTIPIIQARMLAMQGRRAEFLAVLAPLSAGPTDEPYHATSAANLRLMETRQHALDNARQSLFQGVTNAKQAVLAAPGDPLTPQLRGLNVSADRALIEVGRILEAHRQRLLLGSAWFAGVQRTIRDAAGKLVPSVEHWAEPDVEEIVGRPDKLATGSNTVLWVLGAGGALLAGLIYMDRKRTAHD